MSNYIPPGLQCYLLALCVRAALALGGPGAVDQGAALRLVHGPLHTQRVVGKLRKTSYWSGKEP